MDKTVFIIGDSPFLREVEDKIHYITEKFPTIGINNAIKKYNIGSHIFQDMRFVDLTNQYPKVKTITTCALEDMVLKENKECYDSYTFNFRIDTKDNVVKDSKLAWCGFTHDYAISYCIMKGYNRVILVGAADFTGNRHYLTEEEFKYSEKLKYNSKRFIEEILENLARDDSIHKKQRLDIEIYSIPFAEQRNAFDLIERLEDECVGELANIRIAVLKALNALRAGCVFTNVNFTGSTAVSDDKEKVFSNNDMHRYTENDLDKIQNSLDVIKKYCVENDDMGVLTDILDLLNLSLEISKNADDSRMYKKFNTYYLPEMLQMIDQLADLLNTKTTSYVSAYTNERIEKIKQMLRDLKDPFEKILKSLLQEDVTEFDVNLDTMRDMLRMDGLMAD